MTALPVNWLRINHSTLVRLGQMTDRAIVCRKERQRTERCGKHTYVHLEKRASRGMA